MKNAIAVIINDMNKNIEIAKDTYHYKAFYDIHELIKLMDADTDTKLEILKSVGIPEVKEMLYQHYISNLSQDLFYERSTDKNHKFKRLDI